MWLLSLAQLWVERYCPQTSGEIMNAANLKFRIQTLLVLILTLSRCLWADESAISTFFYNGALINNSGQVLAVQGTRQFTVSLYENPFGGAAGYIQTLSNVDVDQGYFSLEIGPALPDISKFRYLELQIDGEVMNPRIELKSFAILWFLEIPLDLTI